MKKIGLLIAVVVATLTIVSCAKEDVNKNTQGQPVTFYLEAPVVQLKDAPDTKVVLHNNPGTSGDVRPQYYWEEGDNIRIISYSLPGGDWSTSEYTDWGSFTTNTVQNGKASFKGYLPDSPETDAYLILHSQSNSSYKVSRVNGTPGRYSISCNIPATQDGTGLHYSIFGARPVYNDGTKTFSFSAINNLATDNTSISAYNNQFALRSALSCFSIPADAHITKVEITVSRSDSAGGQYLASNGEAKDIVINSLNYAFSGGGNSTITIYRGGEELPTDIYFASRQVEGNKSNGYYGILTFVFTNASGKTATKTLKLSTFSGESINVLKNIQCGRLNKLGTVTFGPSDFS